MKSIVLNYSKTPYFKKYKDFFEELYLEKKWNNLSKLNQYLIKEISIKFLNIKTEFDDSRNYKLNGTRMERLIEILKKTEANIYISGPAAKEYINNDIFNKNEIELIYKDYTGYPEYMQLHKEFKHNVSIIDLLFNTGDDAPYYIWGSRKEERKS